MTRTLLHQLTAVPLEKPCDVPWDEMRGDERVRHCASCARDVFDLSAMTAREAEARLLNAGTLTPCIRYARNLDGSVVHRYELRAPQRRVATAAALGLSLAASTVHAADGDKQPAQCVAYALPQSPAMAAMAPTAPSPATSPTPTMPPEPQPLGGAPPPPQRQPDFGTLSIKSTVARQVTIIGVALTAPLTSYLLTPGNFVMDVREADGHTRAVKLTIKKNKTTVIDLDAKSTKK